ncbi:uncharacterized [Tachysurus ichikawai]
MFRKLQHDAELTEIRSELLLNLPCLDEHIRELHDTSPGLASRIACIGLQLELRARQKNTSPKLQENKQATNIWTYRRSQDNCAEAKEYKHSASLDTLRIHAAPCSPASAKITPLRVTQVFQRAALHVLALTLRSKTYRPHTEPFTHLRKHKRALHGACCDGMQTAGRVVAVSCQMLNISSTVRSRTA